MLEELLATPLFTSKATFAVGGTSHLWVIALSLAAAGLLVAAGRRHPEHPFHRRISLALGLTILVSELVFCIYAVPLGFWGANWSLPLHLCDVTSIMCGLALITRSRLATEWTYYFGLSATLVTTATPDMRWDFPHVEFYCFFITHALVSVAAAYMVFGLRRLPRPGAWLRIFALANLFGLAVAAINLQLDSNYLYICKKPQVESLFDLLGPWPWYVGAMELIVLAFLGALSFVEPGLHHAALRARPGRGVLQDCRRQRADRLLEMPPAP